MQPFYRTHYEQDAEKIKALIKTIVAQGHTEEEARRMYDDAQQGEVYMNDVYTVLKRDAPLLIPVFPEMWWLSIKRNDRQPIHDWRDLQEIKNMIVGKENEAAELYPAESRLVDYANQFHLFVFKSRAIKFPFGFNEGRKVDYTQRQDGSVQRIRSLSS